MINKIEIMRALKKIIFLLIVKFTITNLNSKKFYQFLLSILLKSIVFIKK